MKKILYYFGLTQLLLLLFFFKTKTYYQKSAKKRVKGSVIIISNHRSYLDGLVIALRFFFRRLHFLTVNWYKNKRKLLKLVISIAGGIFIQPDGSGINFLQQTKKITKRGQSILVFPEGGYQFSEEPTKFSAGYIILAIKTQSPIIMVANDFNYGLFRRVNLLISPPIYLNEYQEADLNKDLLKELNQKLSNQFLLLYYQLKRQKAAKFSVNFGFDSPKKGDVIRIWDQYYYHYGVYLSDDEVIQFGLTLDQVGKTPNVNLVTLSQFCGEQMFEVRKLKKKERKYLRTPEKIEEYAKSCLGQTNYCLLNNNCLDFANRVTLKI